MNIRVPRICVLGALHLALAASAAVGEAWPLWDGAEPAANYARRVNLPAMDAVDLGGGVKLELVLIPAGKFVMGTPQPVEPVEHGVEAWAWLAFGGGAALGLIVIILVRSIRLRRRPQYSLRWLMVFVLSFGGGGNGVALIVKDAQAQREYAAAKARYAQIYGGETPAHTVTLTQPFYMGKFAATQEQYQQITGQNPSQFKGATNPVEQVSWDDAQEFCKKVSAYSRRTVRLPTDAEREYACRAGTRTTYHSGDTEADLDRVAWYSGNSKNTTHPVGQKEANAFGLFDMHGNVWEWCADWYGDYPTGPVTDPTGPATGAARVLRGGSWDDYPQGCRSAVRYWYVPVNRNYFIGFRVVVVPASRTP